MTPQEFRKNYLQVQDSLGNNLQTLTILSSDLSSILDQVLADYRSLNTIVDQFLSQQEYMEAQEPKKAMQQQLSEQ